MEDGGDGEENTSTRTNSTQEVSEDSEGTNAHTTEQGSSGDVAVQDVNEGSVTVTLHGQTIITELLGNITSRRARELNPETGDESAGTEHVGDVDDELDGISESLREGVGGIQVVDETTNGAGLLLIMRPLTEEADNEVVLPTSGEQLRDDHKVGSKRRDNDDGGVGSVEELDGVETLLTTVLGVLDGQFNTETLEVDNNEEDNNSGEEVDNIRETRTVESITEGTDLILTGDQAVEQGDDGTFEFLTTTIIEGGGGEGSPHNRFTDVGSNEQADTRTNTVSLLEEFVQEENNNTGSRQLDNEEDASEHTEFASRAVHTRDNVDKSSGDGKDDTEQLLDVFVQLTLFLNTGVEDNELKTVEELDNHGGGDNGADTEFHESTTTYYLQVKRHTGWKQKWHEASREDQKKRRWQYRREESDSRPSR